MMEWTDRHCRVFHRVLSRHARLYTEMITADAVIHGDRERLLGFDASEHPVALQLGGCDPVRLAEASRIVADYGYDEINLNIGCPSDRVQSGRFGACLMAEPELVAACVSAMRKSVDVPVTVKCRIGIDDQDSETALATFVSMIADAGCQIVIVHARKAWLQGLSPQENRKVPPLDYDRVYRLKQAHTDLTVVINGGIATLDDVDNHLAHVDGVMIGRAAYRTPWLLADVDRRVFGSDAGVSERGDAVARFAPYVDRMLGQGCRLNQMTRHILGLYHAQPRARAFRRYLSENAHVDGAQLDVMRQALRLVEGAPTGISDIVERATLSR